MPKVVTVGLHLGLHYEYNRAALRGIVSYARPGKPWVLRLQPSANIKCDGYIGNFAKEGSLVDYGATGKPAVNVSNGYKNTALPRVGIDDEGAGETVAKYFHERGFEHFALYDNALQYALERGEGFGGFLRRHKREPHVFSAFVRKQVGGTEDTYEITRRWLLSLPKPIGIFAVNDQIAWTVAEACRDVGLDIPEAVSLVGIDNDVPVCMMAYPPLSSLATPGERIGYEAAAMLDRMFAGEKPPEKPLLLPAKNVITRASSDTLAISDPELAAAVKFIRENAHERIGVRDVLKAVPLARRSMERKFRLILGRSPLEEIRRARIERARELLMNTDMVMPEIASRSGFESAVRLTTVFREETGMTPTGFRRQFRMHGGVETDESMWSGTDE